LETTKSPPQESSALGTPLADPPASTHSAERSWASPGKPRDKLGGWGGELTNKEGRFNQEKNGFNSKHHNLE